MSFYTWGQMRFQLQTAFPGISVDLLDEYLNTRYARILDYYPWKGLEVETELITSAPYTTGTISITQGSAAATGTGTSWSSVMNGMKLRVSGQNEFYTITVVTGTSLTLDRPCEAATNTAAGYSIFQNEYPLPADVKQVLSIESVLLGYPLTELTKIQMAQAAGFRINTGVPAVYAVSADTLDNGTGNALHQVELYPIPSLAIGYPLRYTRSAPGFTGDNTGNAPLPFVSAVAILNGAKAECAMFGQDLNAALAYEKLFDQALQDMVRAETVRRVPQPLQMADIYTRHRVNRSLRGQTRRILN